MCERIDVEKLALRIKSLVKISVDHCEFFEPDEKSPSDAVLVCLDSSEGRVLGVMYASDENGKKLIDVIAVTCEVCEDVNTCSKIDFKTCLEILLALPLYLSLS
jgi:hypothetical protein